MRLIWGRFDAHRWVTWLALFGLAVAAAMAVFGLPPIDLHGPQHHLGIMSPTCGGTRAARLTAQGRLGEAWAYNPLGIAAVLGAAAVTIRATLGLTTGRWANVGFTWTPRRKRIVLTLVVVLGIALEVRQQLRADLLMSGTEPRGLWASVSVGLVGVLLLAVLLGRILGFRVRPSRGR